MRKLGIGVLAALLAIPAFAELQTTQIDGSIRIRANYYTNMLQDSTGAEVRWPAFFLPARPIGVASAVGPAGGAVVSAISHSDDDLSLDFIEQRVRLGVQADFTNEVSLYVELDEYDIWGGDFRSNYVTGVDFAEADAGGELEVYQAYIKADEMWGYPLSLKVGRQEMPLGSQWLVGVNDAAALFTGLSFDGVRLTYSADVFSVDLFATKLFEEPLGLPEQDGDVWFSGLYASYTGLEDITIDGYYFLLRDGRRLNDTALLAPAEWLEDLFGVDDYDPTYIHTIGLRGAGTIGQFDFEAEIAYQWGDAETVGFLFPINGSVYGDDDAEYDEWAMNLEAGYTFDMNYSPRVFLGFAYFGGEDNRDISFWEWLSPFDRPDASVSFNRLFSNWEYTEFHTNTDESNLWIARGGVSVNPTESTEVLLSLAYSEAVDEFDAPRSITFGKWRVPLAPSLSFWTQENDSELGWELGLYGTYNYSEDLSFNAGWAHFFTGDGYKDGQFIGNNGLIFVGGKDDDDLDYFFIETQLSF